MKKSPFSLFVDWLLGTKYYANIINTNGRHAPELACFIFRTRDEANEHRYRLTSNRTYRFQETISFRSRNLEL